MKTNRIVVANPLMAKFTGEYQTTTCWGQFLDDWENSNNVWQWESLLHIGYDLSFDRRSHRDPEYKPIDRLTFYMACADGWRASYESLVIPGESNSRFYPLRHEGQLLNISSGRKRQALSEKAMKMICLYEFKPWADMPFPGRRECDRRGEFFTSELMLPALMHFFSDSRDDKFQHYNFCRPESYVKISHSEEIAFKFVLKLIETILNWSQQSFRSEFYSTKEDEIQLFEERVAKTKARFDEAKAWATEMLVSMREIDWLGQRNVLEDVVLSTLRKIEMRNIVKTPKGERLVKDHKEALVLGSASAWFLERYFTIRGLNIDGTPIRKAKSARRVKRRRTVSSK